MRMPLVLLLTLVLSAVPFLDARRLDVEEFDVLSNCGARVSLTCPSGYIPLADRCYKFHQTTRTWNDARATCAREGGHLASVLTDEQYERILDHINSKYAGTYWISGAVVAGNWIWTSDGTPMNNRWWGRNPGASANQCAYFCSNTLKYWNKSCNGRVRFICERTKTATIPKAQRYRIGQVQ